MKQENDNLTKLNTQLETLEAMLETAYYKLGKKTQAFVELSSKEINALVEEIVAVKQEIHSLKSQKP